MKKFICEACNKNEAVGVCCVPGVPVSCAYCRECLANDNHPMYILVANTACCGGIQNAADWWKIMVAHSIIQQGISVDNFNHMVEENIKDMEDICQGN